ncbi:MAG: hypothetical protein JWN04_668 [Myxococcaceae bacterium]|nr:hypothetical protein [Myxococcaceae bacterium]
MRNKLDIQLVRVSTAALLLACSILLGCFLSPVRAGAQQRTTYEEFVKRGVEEFDQSNWEEAHAMFSRAHALAPNARTWRGIGISAFELRRYVESIDALESSIADTRKPLSPEQREETAALLQRARDYVAVFELKLSPASTRLTVDGQPTKPRDGELWLDPGTRSLLAQAPGYIDQREQLHANAGARETLVIALQRPAETATARKSSAGPTQHDTHPTRPWTWSFAGAAVAVGATGIGLAVATKHQHDDLGQCSTNARGQDCAAATKGLHLQRATNAAFGTAGALVGAAIAAYFLEARAHRRDQQRTMVFPTRNGLMMQASF